MLKRSAITRVVSLDDDDSTEFKFRAVIRCHNPGSYNLNWTATISAADNSDVRNDVLTAITTVRCLGKKMEDDDHNENDDSEYEQRRYRRD